MAEANPYLQVHVGAIWAKVNPVGQALLGAAAAYLAEAWTGRLPTEALRFLQRQRLQASGPSTLLDSKGPIETQRKSWVLMKMEL